MIPTLKQISLFVSSPSNLAYERKQVREICAQINVDVGKLEGFFIEPLMWETHAHSAAGKNAQSVISSQLPDNYHIYFGMMSIKFGSPTANYGSGTEEEFFDAHTPRTKEGTSPEIMFLFGIPSLSIDQLDGIQLAQVQDFRKRIGGLGVLHYSFDSEASFQSTAYSHILAAVRRVIQSTADKGFSLPDAELADPLDSGIDPLSSWKSLLDNDPEVRAHYLIEVAVEQLGRATTSLSRIANSVFAFSKNIQKATNLISGRNSTDIAAASKSVELAVDAFKAVRRTLLEHNPVINEAVRNSTMAVIRSITIFRSLGTYDSSAASGISEPSAALADSIDSAVLALDTTLKIFESPLKNFDAVDVERRKVVALFLDNKRVFESAIKDLRRLSEFADEQKT